MCENKNYGIIREQGEFMEPVMLSQEDNATVNEAASNKNEQATTEDK